MKKYKKLVPTIIAFLLMFPFRLPISVLLVYAFNSIAQLAGKVVPDNVLCANVAITKLVYNLVFGTIFLLGIEKMSRSIIGRKALEYPRSTYRTSEERDCFWWTLVIGILLTAYVIYDTVAATELFWSIIGKPNPAYP